MHRCPVYPPGIAQGNGAWLPDGTCECCGSISGAEALTLVQAGAEVTPLDNDRTMRIGRGRHLVEFRHLNDEQRELMAGLIDSEKVQFAKGYTHFRVLPFFMRGR
jgi:hypothetical protein